MILCHRQPRRRGVRFRRTRWPALARLLDKGLKVDVIASTGPGHSCNFPAKPTARATGRCLCRRAGVWPAHEILRRFCGTSTFHASTVVPAAGPAILLADFTKDEPQLRCRYFSKAVLAPSDLFAPERTPRAKFILSSLSVGFTADVATRASHFKPLGPLGYLLGVFVARCAVCAGDPWHCVATTIRSGTADAPFS